MKYGIYVPNFGAYGDPHNLLELALVAESAGWDGIFLWDHVLLHRHSDIPMVDAWVALAAILWFALELLFLDAAAHVWSLDLAHDRLDPRLIVAQSASRQGQGANQCVRVNAPTGIGETS